MKRWWIVVVALAALLDTVAMAQLVAPQFAVEQGNPAHMAVDGNGGFAFVWHSADVIYGRRYAANGTALNAATPLGEGGASENVPRIGVAADGSFLAVWQDWGFDLPGDVHGRRFASNGAPLTAEFRINTYTSGTQLPGGVAVAPSGSMLVVWGDDYADSSGSGIRAQRFSASGAPVAAAFRVNTTTTNSQRNPVVAATGQGGFVVAWENYVLGNNYDLAAQVFNASGLPLGGQIQVNGFDEPAPQQDPAIAADASGRFILVWTDVQVNEDSTGIYAQRFDASGIRLGGQFRVNAITTGVQNRATVHADAPGRFVVAFNESIGSLLKLREFSSGGVPEADEVPVAFNVFGSPAPMHGNAAGDAVIAWGRQDGASTTILGRRLALSPDALGPEKRVNTAAAGNQWEPAIATTGGSFVVAWTSPNSGYGGFDVMVKRFSANGSSIGADTPISHALTDDHQPSVGGDTAGEFVVVWRADALGYSSITVAMFAASGAPVGATSYLSDHGIDPDVDRNGAGAFVVVWSEAAGGGSVNDIVAQRFGPTGARFGGPFRVNTNTASAQTNPSVGLDASGNFTVVWESVDEDAGSIGIFGRRFSASGQSLGPEFRVNTLTLQRQDQPDVAAASNGEFVVVWRDYFALTLSVQGQRFAATGAALGPQFRVNVENGGREFPRAAYLRNEGFAVVWRSGIPDNHSRARLFRRGGSPIGTEFGIGLIRDAQYSGVPVAAFEGGSGFNVVWEDDEDQGNGAEVKLQQFIVHFCAPGDANGDGSVNVADVLFLINNLFAGGLVPTSCANVNGDLSTNVSDILYLINYLFAGGPAPV